MNETLLSASFLLTTGSSVCLSALLAWLTSFWYRVDEDKKIVLRVDPLMAACNTGVAVSGIAAPLLVALFVFAQSQLKQTPSDLSFLASSIALVSLSAAAGLWAVFSLAAVGRDTGTFGAHRGRHLYLASYSVFQLGLLMSGLLALALYVAFGLHIQSPSLDSPSTSTLKLILRPQLAIGQTQSEVAKMWGEPDSRSASPSLTVWSYASTSSSFEIVFQNNVVTTIIEKSKRP